MPCSQMISMNCMPPRPIEASRPARLPAQKARIRNRFMWNIGSETWFSMNPKTTSSTAPPMIPVSTQGLVQPCECPPYGWMP